MGGSSKKGGTQGIDFQELLGAQADLNRIDTSSPFGSQTFDDEGNASFQFSGPMQQLFQRATQQGPQFDPNSLDPISRVGDFDAQRGRVEDALFERSSRLLNPVFNQQEDRLRSRLSNQGIPVNAEAAGGEFGELTRFGQNRNRAFQDAANNAILGGSQESSRLLGEARASRGQQIGDFNLARGTQAQDFNQFLGLLGGSQAVRPHVTPIDVTGPAQLQLQNQANRNNKKGGVLGGLTDLGSAGILASKMGPAAAAAPLIDFNQGPF